MLFIDALVVKSRDGQVTNRPIYVVVGVTVNGERDILRLWAGDGGEGATCWLAVGSCASQPSRLCGPVIRRVGEEALRESRSEDRPLKRFVHV